MNEIINQAPDYISKEDIEIIFKKNNENVIDTLIDLWNIDVPKSANKIEDDNIINFKNDKNKWKNIRNVCDSYDIEMEAHLKNFKINGN